jgi:HEAT repeat protein
VANIRLLIAGLALSLLSLPAPAEDPPAEEKKPPTHRQVLAALESYAEKHPEDLVGIRDRYLDARAKLPIDSAAFSAATQRIDELDEEVAEAYRLVRPSEGDPPKLSERKRAKTALRIARDLKKRASLVRQRAAEYLGRLGCDSGAAGLVRRLGREKEEAVRAAIVKALVAIGGPKVGELIQYKLFGAARDVEMAALDVLEALIAESDDAEDKRASLAAGRFVFAKDPDVVERALMVLMKAGGEGVWGLIMAAGVGDHQLKLRVIRALGQTGEGRAAVALVRYLDVGAKGLQAEYKKAAVASLRRIGVPIVPWLVRYLEDPNCRQWTKRVLYDVTGQSFERAEEVLEWWGRHNRKKAAK